MTTQFQDQGGAATMDPNPVARWIASRLMTRLFSEERILKKHAAAEKKRRSQGLPHRVEYFHQIDDGYSHLAAQVLAQLSDRYDIELVCHLVSGPSGKNVAQPELLSRLSRYEAFHIASGYGLEFPDHPLPPAPELVELATGILAAQGNEGFIACAEKVGKAVWAADADALQVLAEQHGTAPPDVAAKKVATGMLRQTDLKHYASAMFHYGGEWYWGVDRLYHLEHRLAELGADRRSSEKFLAPRPQIDAGDVRDSGSLTLEFYPSLRSPYTAIAYDRTLQLAEDSGVNLVLRPVLPMVMRGVPATREKGMYIFMDAAREARAAGVPCGNFYDPIGNPVRRCYSLYPWAVAQGKGSDLLSSFLNHAFALGVNTNTDKGLRRVVEGAGLDWTEAQSHLGDSAWTEQLEANRLTMYEAGLWGVPSYRLLDSRSQPLLALWGQDRLWVIANMIKKQLQSS